MAISEVYFLFSWKEVGCWSAPHTIQALEPAEQFLQKCVNHMQWEDTAAPNLSIFYNDIQVWHMNVYKAAAGLMTILVAVIDFLLW